MPPVRWKSLLVVGFALVQLLILVEAQHVQESISISADGWRPIIGTRRIPAFESEIKTQEITQYKHPSQNVEVDIVKAETILPSSTVEPQKFPPKVSTDTVNNNINGDKLYKQGGKIPPHSKFTSPGQYHTIPSSAHGPHIPIGAAHSRPGQFGQLQKRPPNKPSPPHFGLNLKRKPVRTHVAVASPSSRDEVFVRPPNSGQFSSFIKGPNNIKTRDTQNLLGNNHFSIKPSSHIEFGTGFALPPSTDNFQQFKSQPVYVFSQSPSPNNEIRFQNDVYTRNLVPPPPSPFQQEKEKLKNKIKDNAVAVTEPVIKFTEFNSNSQQFGLKPVQYQENLVPQLPPDFEQSFAFQKHFNKPKDGADVQVTKEKLKVFHSSAPIFNTNDYVDYDYHSARKPDNLPKLQTYEVTEGKWIDSPNPFTFGLMEPRPVAPQKVVMQLATASPTPIVELNVSPFLPTPYRPAGVLPTSPTQSEASTVFTLVSNKMNRYKNEALTKNPLFFDVKEVSTHYPILGKPAPLDDSSPVMDTKGEISNEITTLKQVQISEAAAPATKRPKTRRRRPQPRRTTTTTTSTTIATTTSEEPAVTESYEVQKTQDTYEEVSMETTERPQRRQRPRPNRIRTNGNYEAEDITEKRIRGRQRNRQRGYGTRTETQNDLPRRRKRPLNTETTYNHRMPDDSLPLSDETTETIVEQPQSTEQETQGIFETKYTREREEGTTIRPSKIEAEFPARHYEATQSEEESKYATTIVSSEASPVQRPRYGEAKEAATDKGGFHIGTTTEYETTANIHLPENEVDYSTPVPTIESGNEHIQSTLATTLPTTTTPEATTKSHRIRGRPVKYGSSNRPRFSVKDYRQRLNQYTSTTPSTTTDIVRTTSDGIRLRFPTRKLRTRPTTRTTTQSSYYEPEEEHTESIRRGGFKPKEPRHGVTSTETPLTNIITEKNVKAVNTRLRPFGRYKPTTETTASAPKVSIKPNLFSARRRSPAQLNLRMRAYGRPNKNVTEETTTYGSEVELTEPITVQTTDTEDDNVATETGTDKLRDAEAMTEADETTTVDLSDFDYSQRVSELTSSVKNQYETPGLFKAVSPTSRRIPSYFTISTDDPILPIEAFFPNLKDKTR